MKKTVLFDLDGTLLDTERIYQKYWRIAGEEAGYRLTAEQFLEFRSLNRADALVKMREMTGSETALDEIRDLRRKYMGEAMAQGPIPRKPQAREALMLLREHGFLLAVVTATEINMARDYLTRSGLYPLVDEVISAHMVEKGKPAPDVYLYACERLGVQPADTFAVEDAPNGILSASAAGCRTIMVPDLSEPDDALREKLVCCAKDLADAARYILSCM